MKKLVSILIAIVLTLSLFPTNQAKADIQLSDTILNLTQGDTFALKINIDNRNDIVIWNSTNKSVATITSDGTVTAVGIGKSKITAKAGKKKYICKVNVTKSIDEIKPIDAYQFIAYEVWSHGISSLDNYTRFGKSVYEDDFDTTLKNLQDNIKKLSEYNDKVNAFDGEEYDDFKAAWKQVYDYALEVYSSFDSNPPCVGHKETWIDISKFQKLLRTLNEECSYF